MDFRLYNLCRNPSKYEWLACQVNIMGKAEQMKTTWGIWIFGVALRTNKIRVFTLRDYFTLSLSLTLLSSQQCATWNQLVWIFSVPWVALLYIFVDFRVNTPWIFFPYDYIHNVRLILRWDHTTSQVDLSSPFVGFSSSSICM